jgi:hypothetical protein
VFLPRGVEHAFAVASERARVLSLFVPAGFEGFYREMVAADVHTLEVERLVVLAARYGCEITGPAPSPPETGTQPLASRTCVDGSRRTGGVIR